MKNLILIIILTFSICQCYCQSNQFGQSLLNKNSKFRYETLLLPSFLIGYGFIGIENKGLKLINAEIKNTFKSFNLKNIAVDDITQYAPALSVYGLSVLGIKGKNNFKDRSIILGTAYITMTSAVYSLKKITNIERPDGSSKRSFPSGHTATAFMGAEFLYQEYKDVSLWYGFTGYLVATGTGFLRMYNNKHWLTDIVAGAGIGILSTKLAYWLHPIIKKNIFKDDKNINAMAIPYFNGTQYGIGINLMF